jgi:hypothetical protein
LAYDAAHFVFQFFLKVSSNHRKRICVAPSPAGLAAKILAKFSITASLRYFLNDNPPSMPDSMNAIA